MVAHQADIHLRFQRPQLFIDLHSPWMFMFMFNHHTHSSGYFLNSPACQTFINLDSLGFVICHYCSIKKRSFVVTVAN